MLYIVATPLGNLSDITLRALESLKSCDYILCEDTRTSRVLLDHYHIQKPLVSYHKFSEAAQQKKILEDLSGGKNIALISDAGTPGIADPGTRLVSQCRAEKIGVTPIPGPSAVITALCASGLPTDRFQFLGFLPKKQKELLVTLQEAIAFSGTSVLYESPHRLLETLSVVDHIAPQTVVCVCRELTKIYEEFVQGTAKEVSLHWTTKGKEVKGEIVLLLWSGGIAIEKEWANSAEEQVSELCGEGLSLKDAVHKVAEMRGLNKRTLYKKMHST